MEQQQQQRQRYRPFPARKGVILRITNAERQRPSLDDSRTRRRLPRKRGNTIVTPSRSTPLPPSHYPWEWGCRPNSHSSHARDTPKKEMTIRGHPHLRSFLVENFLPDRRCIDRDTSRDSSHGIHEHGNCHCDNQNKCRPNRNGKHCKHRKCHDTHETNVRAKYRILRHAINSVSPLIRSGMDRPGGIQLSVDNPWKSRHFVVNVERPAVLRQYFGRTVEKKRRREVEGTASRIRGVEGKGGGNDRGNGSDGEFVKRYCYGSGTGVSSVGIVSFSFLCLPETTHHSLTFIFVLLCCIPWKKNPKHFVTREMTPSMTIVADEIHNYLKVLLKSDKSLSIEPFNHVTVLLYYEKTPLHDDDDENAASTSSSTKPSTITPNSTEKIKNYGRNHLQLPYHTDNVYSKTGKFIHSKNSQKQHTITAILTLGDERILHFQKQCLYKNHSTGIMKWRKCHEGEYFERFRMGNGSLFVLHPEDEVPMFRRRGGIASSGLLDEAKSRFLHGGIRNNGGGMDNRAYDFYRDPNNDCRLSIALVFRTVTAELTLHRVTGKFPDSLDVDDSHRGDFCDDDSDQDNCSDSADSTMASSSTASSSIKNKLIDEKLAIFRRERLKRANSNLQLLWCSVCMRYFGCLLDFGGKHSSKYSLRKPYVLSLGDDD